VQGKALAAALLLSLCLLAGCGGGGGGHSSSTSSAGSESSAQPTSPQGGEEAAAQLRQSAGQIKREREGPPAQGDQGPGPAQDKSPDQGQAAALPPAQPPSTHRDSGGGTAPFATKAGDNSIQESGREGSPAETQAAAAVLHAYLDARVEHRWDDACFYMAASMAATIEAFAGRFGKDKGIETCPEVLAALARGSSQEALVATARADVGALRIEGGHGFLLYRGAGGDAYAMPMVMEGTWKVGSLEGTPLG
jgi:hypothetical protein